MTAVIVEIIFLALLIVGNGVFAMSELAVVSARKLRLQEQAERGSRGARVALDLAETPNQFLSTVQIGITLVGVLAGAIGGATLANALADAYGSISSLAPYREALGLGTVVLLITYFSLVIGELVPKRIALQYPERVAVLVARPMNALAMLAFPVVRVLSASSNLVVRVLGITPPDEPPVTEEEIRTLVAQGTRAGIFNETEQDLVESAFRLDEREVGTVMTPYTELTWLDITDPPDRLRQQIIAARHSHVPVGRAGLDNMLGMLPVRDVLGAALNGQPLELEKHLCPPRFVPENVPVLDILDTFKDASPVPLLVIDEHGGIQGLVTGHDLLEAIVGHFTSPMESRAPTLKQRADGSWLLDGLLPIEDAQTALDLEAPPGAEEGHFRTLGGFIMSLTGEIPKEGECFRWGGFRFEIVDMDGYRVDKLLATRDPEAAPGPCESEDDPAD
ncbi:MAG: HlyC/CorC family transporter [Chloroflexi bacterium]|nr:HlyC/CorC family transporter [Chloroflexota bacterium]